MKTNNINIIYQEKQAKFDIDSTSLIKPAAAPAAAVPDSDNSSTTDALVPTAIYFRPILSLTNLDFLYVFQNPIPQEEIHHLKQSLAQVLNSYPAFAGRLINKGKHVHLNNDGACFKVQQETSGCSIHNIPEEPPTGPPYCHIPIPQKQIQGEAPLLTITVSQFLDGWTLGVVLNHIVADGWTFAAFMRDWSKVNCGEPIEPTISQLPSIVLETYPTEQEAEMAAYGILGEIKAPWLKRQFIGAAVKSLIPSQMQLQDPRLATCYDRMKLHFTRAQVQIIKQRAMVKVQKIESSLWISTNEAVMVHVWKVLLAAARLSNSQQSHIGVSCVVNLREKLAPAVTSRVLGNVVGHATAVVDFTESANVEVQLHNGLRSALSERKLLANHKIWNRMFSETSQSFDLYQKTTLDVVFGGVPGCLSWNWQASNPFYQIDLGGDGTRLLRGIPWNWNQPVTVLPSPDGDGIDVFIDKTKRGPVGWKTHGSKWSVVHHGLGILAVACPLFVLRSGTNFRLSSISAAASIAIFGTLWKTVGARVRNDVEASKQAFHNYVQSHVYDGLVT